MLIYRFCIGQNWGNMYVSNERFKSTKQKGRLYLTYPHAILVEKLFSLREAWHLSGCLCIAITLSFLPFISNMSFSDSVVRALLLYGRYSSNWSLVSANRRVDQLYSSGFIGFYFGADVVWSFETLKEIVTYSGRTKPTRTTAVWLSVPFVHY